jgi:hypothetical protein
VDIAQAVGRAMRKPRGKSEKTVGYVFVPLFVGEEGETIEDAIKSTQFDAVADVLNALQEHDEELVDLIRELRQAKGEGKPFKPRITGEKIELIGPRVDLARVVESVETRIADRLGTSWDEWYGQLTAYKQREGHTKVPRGYQTTDGSKLGSWVSVQRQIAERLSASRRQKLDELGFVWNPQESLWEEYLSALQEFSRINGHLRVAGDHVTESGLMLGQWVYDQRMARNRLSQQRIERLDNLGFIWDPEAKKWDEGLQALQEYFKENGHSRVPASARATNGFALGSWVRNLRKNKKKISNEHLRRLTDLGFTWSPLDDDWEDGMSALRDYFGIEGHARVPKDFVTKSGFRLGNWVTWHRARKNKLSPQRVEQLSELDFCWNTYDYLWDNGYSALVEFVKANGHARVPNGFVTDRGFRLGKWVTRIRTVKNSLKTSRIEQLQELQFVWDPYNQLWEEGFSALHSFAQEVGHARVPKSFVSDDGFELGRWVLAQRQKISQLSPDLAATRRERLSAVGFVWDVHQQAWEEGYTFLKKFRETTGHVRVPRTHVTQDGYKLGQWVKIQRKNRQSMTAERRNLLDALGFIWIAQ